MNVVAITIGNRDVVLSKTKLPDNLNTCRQIGNYILSKYEKLKDEIDLPIIQPFLDVLEDRKEKINHFFLIATDQDDKRYRDKDSINFAKIIKKQLERKFKESKIHIIMLKNDINNYLKNYEFFQKELRNIPNIQEIDKFYVLPVGGMPNINSPFNLVSIMLLKEKVFQYYVDEIQKNAYPISFNHKFLSELEKERIKPALDRFFFASVSNISSNDFIKRFSNYAYSRISFNFKNAKIIIDDLLAQYPDKDLKKFNESITEIRNYQDKKLQELFFSAIIKIKQEQYVDALLRLYNFTDNLFLNKVCEQYGLKLEPEKDFTKWWFKAINKIKNENPNIESSLEKINGNNADLSKKGVPLYSVLIKYKNKDCNIFEITEPLLAISDLRNKSIAAHGFEGVSLEKINEKLEKFELNLNDLIEKIETYLGARFEDSDYYRIADIISNNLDK